MKSPNDKQYEPHTHMTDNKNFLCKWLNSIQKWDPDLILEIEGRCESTGRLGPLPWKLETNMSQDPMYILFFLKKTYKNIKRNDESIQEKDLNTASSFTISFHQDHEFFITEVQIRMRYLFDHGYVWKTEKSPSALRREAHDSRFAAFDAK